MDADQTPRYFVTVMAAKADDLRALQPRGLDLFAPTARREKGRVKQPFRIDGLLSRQDIDQLSAKGYGVEVKDDAQTRAAASDAATTLDYDAWRRQLDAQIAKDRAVK
jgi:hypothetical protein